MLVRVNKLINDDKVSVTKLDIDDNGSITTVEDLELDLPSADNSIIEILKNSQYACVFTTKSTNIINENESKNTILIANAMTLEELAQEQSKTIDAVRNKRK
ncbi:MAG TPA: hypothetical protein VH796_00100 [Nitrososphaeraceae archaeon]|jgi:hypothetical protein